MIDEQIPKLQRFIALLRESNITGNDLNELTELLEKEKTIKLKSMKSLTKSQFLFTHPITTITTTLPFQPTYEIK